jgi:hypothetical protein
MSEEARQVFAVQDADAHLLADDLDADLFVGAGLRERGDQLPSGRFDDVGMESGLAQDATLLLPGLDLDGAQDMAHALFRDDGWMVEAAGLDLREALHLAHVVDLDVAEVDEGFSGQARGAAARKEGAHDQQEEEGSGGRASPATGRGRRGTGCESRHALRITDRHRRERRRRDGRRG